MMLLRQKVGKAGFDTTAYRRELNFSFRHYCGVAYEMKTPGKI